MRYAAALLEAQGRTSDAARLRARAQAAQQSTPGDDTPSL
jgi:hypothetical protein